MDASDLIAAPRELLTPRLRLVAPQPAHAPAFLAWHARSLPAMGFISWGQRPWDLAQAQGFYDFAVKLVARGECLIFDAFRRDTGAYSARIDLHTWDFEAPRAELGYVGDATLAGQGYTREAAQAVMALGFEMGLMRIHALCDARNEPSQRFARQALGMAFEGRLRAYERDPQGQLADMMMFAAYNSSAV